MPIMVPTVDENGKTLVTTKKKNDARIAASEEQGRRLVNTGSNGDSNAPSVFSGTLAERQGQIAGLRQGEIGYGQGLGQTGQDIQNVKKLQDARTAQSGADPVSAAIMSQKAGAMANAQRNMQASGVKGGAAAGAVADIGRQQNADIAASLYGQQRQSIADQRSLAGNMLSGTTSLMQGERAVGTSQSMPSAPGGGGMSVICSKLYFEGYMPIEVYIADTNYGIRLRLHAPETIIGYHLWAKPTVRLMEKSKLFTKLISYPAMAWAYNMAGKKNLLGNLISKVGEPICFILGKLVIKLSGEKYAY